MHVAVVGAGPAGIYAANILTNEDENSTVDIFDRLPAPFGLVRYGVAPDHPRIKEIIKALWRVMTSERIRFLGNVRYGQDLNLETLYKHYDAVIFATGAHKDRSLDIPGIDLPGSFGAADFVSWYGGHPDASREWPLTAESVAVIGAGNVALDIARMLAKPADEQLTTEIPDNVYRGLAINRATDVHIFARRGPAQLKFTPTELRELSHSPSIEVLVPEDGFQIDASGQDMITANKTTRLVVDVVHKYLSKGSEGKKHRIHLHMMQLPVEILGDSSVEGLRTERAEFAADGSVHGTGEFTDWPVQAVYRAVGYLSSHLPDVPFDHEAGVVPNKAGRVLNDDGTHIARAYVTGWIKRGPIGLIGHTKSDAAETVKNLMEDLASTTHRTIADRDAIYAELAGRGVEVVSWSDWERLDAYERSLGEAAGRERIKVVPRTDMVKHAKSPIYSDSSS